MIKKTFDKEFTERDNSLIALILYIRHFKETLFFMYYAI